MGFYCVDNLPVELIPIFAELHAAGGDFARPRCSWMRGRVATGKVAPAAQASAQRSSHHAGYIEAVDDALLRRYSETRRPHPLGKELPVRESLRYERKMMEPIRKLADVTIDTTQFNVHELPALHHRAVQESRSAAVARFCGELWMTSLGLPSDSDLVFDVRFLAESAFCSAFAPLHRRKDGPKFGRFILSYPQTDNSCADRRMLNI